MVSCVDILINFKINKTKTDFCYRAIAAIPALYSGRRKFMVLKPHFVIARSIFRSHSNLVESL